MINKYLLTQGIKCPISIYRSTGEKLRLSEWLRKKPRSDSNNCFLTNYRLYSLPTE